MEGKLNNFQVGHLPTVIYKPDFITESEEMLLLDKVVIPLLLFLPFLFSSLLNWLEFIFTGIWCSHIKVEIFEK